MSSRSGHLSWLINPTSLHSISDYAYRCRMWAVRGTEPWYHLIWRVTEAPTPLDSKHYTLFSHGFRSGYTSMTNIFPWNRNSALGKLLRVYWTSGIIDLEYPNGYGIIHFRQMKTLALHGYPSLRTPGSILPTTMESLRMLKDYTSFQSLKKKDLKFNCLWVSEHCQKIHSLHRQFAACWEYNNCNEAGNSGSITIPSWRGSQLNMKPEKQITPREFNKIFPVLKNDLIAHAWLGFVLVK